MLAGVNNEAFWILLFILLFMVTYSLLLKVSHPQLIDKIQMIIMQEPFDGHYNLLFCLISVVFVVTCVCVCVKSNLAGLCSIELYCFCIICHIGTFMFYCNSYCRKSDICHLHEHTYVYALDSS